MNEVQITRNGEKLSETVVSDSDWAAINYVDYIEVDDFDRVTPEFVRVHGLNAACRMQKIVGDTFNLVADDSGSCEHNWVDSSYANETCTNCFQERGKRFDIADDSGAVTLPYALLGIAGYMVYWMVAHGIIQALTALQAGR